MKKYTDEEILTYARSHVRRIDREKGKPFIVGFFLVGGVVMVVSLVSAYFDKCKKTGGNPFEDLSFLSGFAFGVASVVYVGLFTLCFIRMYSFFYGKEIAVYRLLVKQTDAAKQSDAQ
jgi:hypothetical protein